MEKLSTLTQNNGLLMRKWKKEGISHLQKLLVDNCTWFAAFFLFCLVTLYCSWL